MMYLRIKVILLAIILHFISTSAMAAEKESLHSIILSGGRAMAQHGCESPWATRGTPSSECSESSQMYRVAYNYKLTPAWGIEISGGDLGRPYVEGTGLDGGPSTWEMKIDGWTVAGVGFLNIGDSLSLFGKVGFVRSHFKDNYGVFESGLWQYGASWNGVPSIDEDRNGLTYGAGIQVDFSKNIGLRFQYENFGQYDIYSAYGVSTPEKISLTATSVGLVINF